MEKSMKKSNNGLSFKKFFSKVFGMKIIFIWIYLAVYLLFFIVSPSYRSFSNILEVFRLASIGALLYLGLTWVIAAGELDLSFSEVAVFVGVVFAMMLKSGMNVGLSAFLAFCLGILWGVINGVLIGILKLPSLIATLAVGAAARGLQTTLAGGRPVHFDSVGTVINYLVFGQILTIPVSFIIVLVFYLVVRFVQDRTTLGHYIYIIGENKVAAKAAGINQKNIIFGVFILSAALSSLAGILITGFYASGNPEFGSFYLLDGLLAVYLGSLIIKDVKPNLMGTFISVIFLGVLVNGFTILGFPSYIASITKGALLLGGVIIVFIRKNNINKGLGKRNLELGLE